MQWRKRPILQDEGEGGRDAMPQMTYQTVSILKVRPFIIKQTTMSAGLKQRRKMEDQISFLVAKQSRNPWHIQSLLVVVQRVHEDHMDAVSVAGSAHNIIASPKGNAISDCVQVNAGLFNTYFLFVCVCL